MNAPRTSWCFWCRRAVRHDDDEARRVLVGFDTQWMCGFCYERSDPPTPLDMMEYEGDDDGREGQPEFNGAFGG